MPFFVFYEMLKEKNAIPIGWRARENALWVKGSNSRIRLCSADR